MSSLDPRSLCYHLTTGGYSMAHKLFVGNLSAKVSDDDVRGAFKKFGDIVKIVRPRPGSEYCNMYFATEKAAQEAFEEMNNQSVFGRRRLWCNIRLKHEKEEFISHTIIKENITVKNSYDTTPETEVLRTDYQKYGKLKEVCVPKHLVGRDRIMVHKGMGTRPSPSVICQLSGPFYRRSMKGWSSAKLESRRTQALALLLEVGGGAYSSSRW